MLAALKRWGKEAEPWYLAMAMANLVMGTSSILVPLMISKVLQNSVRELGLLSTLVSLVGILGSLIWGRLSDAAHRRKPFIVLSFAATGLAFAGVALTQTFDTLLFINMTLNFFWVANASVMVLIVIENRERSEWEHRISRLNQFGALGWLVGLIFGSLVLAVATRFTDEVTAIRLMFWLLAVGGVGATALAVRWVPYTRARLTKRRFRGIVTALGNFLIERGKFNPLHLYHRLHPSRISSLLRGGEGLRHETRLFLIIDGLAFTAFGLVFVPLPLLFADELDIPAAMIFSYFVLNTAVVVLTYPFASHRIKRKGNRAIQVRAVATRFVSFTLLAVLLGISPTSLPALIISGFMIAAGISWSYFQLSGIALATRLARPENRGHVLGLYNAMAGLGMIIAGVSSGYLAQWLGYSAVFAVAAALLAVTLFLLHRLPDPNLQG
ncbi:MAG: MFS transporter [Candidatus Bipolaricaulota bacterium]|nr:MFS transporter [Candidatus Bipolaricaulota bacterium]